MTSSHYCLSSKTYKSRVFEGFSRLQQNDEFVDMTLAAEGCLVKVHRTLIALASPFLKELLKSVPCKHPVLFLSNITHKALCFILEYIYTGEVNIPNEDIKPFFNAAQAMHITGLENIVIPQTKDATWEEDRTRHIFQKSRLSSAANRACIIINDIQNVQLPIVNQAEIHPITQEPSPPFAATENLTRNNTNIDLNGQQSNESDTENVVLPISSGVPVSGKISDYLSIYVKTETRENPNANEDINNINTIGIGNIENKDIHTLPMIIEGHGSLYDLQLSNNISNNTTNTNNYTNDQNVVNQPIANAASTSQGDLSSLMNISNTSLIQDNDMAADISISDLIDNNLAETLSTTNDMTENVETKRNEAIHLTKCDNVVSQNTGKEIVKESVGNMPSATELLEGNNVETESEHAAADSGYMCLDQMNEALEKDSDSVIYMVSKRGSLQTILHHYIYNCQYVRNNSNRRWRCIDYKKLKCLALFDTHNGVITNRQLKHCHKNHDDKIYIKVMKRHCFPTIEMAQKSIKRKNLMSEREHIVVDTIEIDDEM